MHERRGVLAEPSLKISVRFKFLYLNAVDGRPRLTDSFDVLFGHLADPKHLMPLQSGVSEIDGTLIQRPVEVAAPDQNEIDEIPGEFQKQPVGGVILPCPQPCVGEPDAVAVPETELHRSRLIPESPQIGLSSSMVHLHLRRRVGCAARLG